jgi:hypothetical protein
MAAVRPVPDHLPVIATDVVRGVSRLFARSGGTALAEVPLPNGRRADILAIDPRGLVSIIEVKVARADLMGDTKWPDYLDWCDRFYWALSPVLNPDWVPPGRDGCGDCGLIVADRYDAAIIREADVRPMATARRKAEMLRIARLGMARMMRVADPEVVLTGDVAY